MVLSTMPIGECDKRLVILTKENGKISAFAKGARRPNSALLACSQPFAFGEFALYGGRTSYNLLSAEISNYFGELRTDFPGLCHGFYFCEFAEYLTKENNDEKEVLKLLYQTLRALSKKTIDTVLIRSIFELKIMAVNGEAPQVFGCVKCDKNSSSAETDGQSYGGQYYFSPNCGGILCEDCRGYDKGAIRINTSTLYAMQYIVSKEIEKLYTFRVTAEVQEELSLCMKHYLGRYVEHEFKSLEMLKGL
ncbi:DNA repair protein RecO [Anaerotaenia torta]|uniref:DNA repair protein RecO n=1 Tax=Anaerotaenia torta TaxID=433293 RepID=UPI003D1A3496